MADTGDGLESKDLPHLQTMISDRNLTAEMMVKRVWPRVDSWKVQWSEKLTSMRFKVRWHDDSPKGTITLSEAQWAKCRKHGVHCAHLNLPPIRRQSSFSTKHECDDWAHQATGMTVTLSF